MSINSLRKNYENLTMLQRLSLADNALGRDDDSEALAIKNASPRIAFTQSDFSELFNQIMWMRLCNLIERLNYVMNFDFLLHGELEKLINKSSLRRSNRINDDLKLAGFLYVRATDAWNAINKELGLRPNFDEEIGQNLFSINLLRSRDHIMRSIAFSETEARAHIKQKTGMDEFWTVEKEMDAYREILGLKKR